MSFGKSSNWQGVTRPLRSPKLNHLHGLTRQHEVKLAGHDLRVLLMLASKIEARWGLIPHWAKDAKIVYSTTHARRRQQLNRRLEARTKRVGVWCRHPGTTSGSMGSSHITLRVETAQYLRSRGLWETWYPKEAAPLTGHTFTCSALVQRPMLPTGRRVKFYRWQNAQPESAYHGVCDCRRSTPPSVRRTIKSKNVRTP